LTPHNTYLKQFFLHYISIAEVNFCLQPLKLRV